MPINAPKMAVCGKMISTTRPTGKTAHRETVLFGARSPIVVEFEEVCARAGIPLVAAISVNGTPRVLNRAIVVSLEDMGNRFHGLDFIPVAFSPQRRRDLHDQGLERGLRLAPAAVDPSAVLFSSARVREGTFVNAGAIVGALSIIGSCCLLNRSVSIGHHSIIDDFVSIGPGATLASNARVGEASMIGAGCTILPNVEIGAGSFIAAGSVVRKSMGPGMLISGNPARELRPYKQPAGFNRDDDE